MRGGEYGDGEAEGSGCLVRLVLSYDAHDVDDWRFLSPICLGMVEHCDSCTVPRASLGDE